ncbi:MAG: hypothetical protein LBL72_06405 [Candidatus Accumulibacter sp.]|jgi:hypothetical protein|nr:hypothetical protein [Accumulibacter sp.]
MTEEKPELLSVPKRKSRADYLQELDPEDRCFLPFLEGVTREDRSYLLKQNLSAHLEEEASLGVKHTGAEVTRLVFIHAALNVFGKHPAVWKIFAQHGITQASIDDITQAIQTEFPNKSDEQCRDRATSYVRVSAPVVKDILTESIKQVAKTPDGRDDSDLVAEAFCNYIERRFPKKILEHKAPTNVIPLRFKS